MIKIGITGGIGAGKSTVAKVFSALGVPIYDADSRAKWLQENNLLLIEGIKSVFGNEAYSDAGSLNKVFIASKVFSDKIQLSKLNELVHPVVFSDFEEWCAKYAKSPYILKEAALMFETDSYKLVDKVLLVTAPTELRVERILKRDSHRKESDILGIMASQQSDEEKAKKADYRLNNDEKHLLLPQILELHQLFKKL